MFVCAGLWHGFPIRLVVKVVERWGEGVGVHTTVDHRLELSAFFICHLFIYFYFFVTL